MNPTNKKMLIIACIFVFAAVIIGLTFLSRRNSGIDYRELIKAKDETIQAERQVREAERKFNDFLISELKAKDSVLQIRVKTNTIRYEKIPVTVSNLSDDELRSAVENYR